MKTNRSYTALDLVHLPRFDAGGAQGLGEAVLAAARGVALSHGAKLALGEVEAGVRAVVEASVRRLAGPGAGGSPLKEADARVDAAWSGTYDWLTGWTKLPGASQAPIAAELRAALFPDGLRFVQFKFAKEWAESNTRLEAIDKGHLAARFDALGGGAFLQSLRASHRAYGEALGITKAPETPEEAQRLRDALAQFADALRDYVLQVSAMVRKDDAASIALADKLLAPIMTWEASGKSNTGAGAGKPQQSEEALAAAPAAKAEG